MVFSQDKDAAAHPVQAAASKFQPSLFAAGLLTGTRAGEAEMGRKGAYHSQGRRLAEGSTDLGASRDSGYHRLCAGGARSEGVVIAPLLASVSHKNPNIISAGQTILPPES